MYERMAERRFESLSGPDKAAILMLALGEEKAAKLLAQLDPEEIKEISRTMSVLGAVEGGVVEQLLEEFDNRLGGAGHLVGSFETTEKLLRGMLEPGKVETLMAEIRGPAGRTVWDKLDNVNESVLASYLRNEYPQTIAVVLSRLRPEHAARVLSKLPDGIAADVVMRMLRMEVVQKDVLHEVEKTLRTEFMSTLAGASQRDTHEQMAEIFNNLDRATENRFTAMLEERSRESADRIRKLMFTFEDLKKLDAAGVQTLLRTAGNDRLAVALKGASEELRELIFENMSERAAKILREDMEALGPVRVRDVEEAQLYLVNTAKELAANGEIVLADGKDEPMIS